MSFDFLELVTILLILCYSFDTLGCTIRCCDCPTKIYVFSYFFHLKCQRKQDTVLTDNIEVLKHLEREDYTVN